MLLQSQKSPARIILHPGAPKTGSTSLQHYFCDHAAALEAAGMLVPKRRLRQGEVDPLHRDMKAAMKKGNDGKTVTSE